MKQSSLNICYSSCKKKKAMVDDNDKEDKDEPRSKSRNLSEKKRRDQFNMLINELCSMVSTSNRKMDKSSVLRSTIAFLRNHSEVSVQSHTIEVQENWKPSFLSNEEFTHLMLEALDGFIIVFTCTGRILYTSESITSLLGYLPSDISSSVFDLVHDCDKPSLYKLINNAPSSVEQLSHYSKDSCLSLHVHMKHGPIHSLGTPTYELVRLVGAFHHWASSVEGTKMCNFEYDSNSCSSACSPLSSAPLEWRLCFVAMARLQTPQLLREVNLSDGTKNEFTSRHSLEWKFLFLDHRAPPIIGYLPFEVLGTSGYDYYHVDDLERIAACHEALMQTGEGTSCLYRFLTKGQQWLWLRTRYYITYHQWNSKPEFIVCTHTVVSYEPVHIGLHEEKSKNVNSPAQTNTNLPPSQSTCMSPTPSLSSRGSLSSSRSDRCSVATSSVPATPVLFESYQGNRNPSPAPPNELHFTKKLGQQILIEEASTSNPLLAVQQQLECPVVTQINPTFSPSQGNISAQGTASVVTIATIQPLMGLSGPSILTTSNIPGTHSHSSQTERLQPAFIMTPSQSQLQDYLRKRHQLLQQQILLQQEELRRVSEQLMLVQFVAPNLTASNIPYQPVVSTVPSISNSDISRIHPVAGPVLQSQLATHPSNETVISKSVVAPAVAQQQPVVTSTSLMNPEPGSHVPAPQQVMSLQLGQDVVFAQGFSSSHSVLQNT